ncbi:MAG: hypothetical protein HY897_21335 [Deltaproteobacteria bacterium]|nr:hypothetical protein [Deltaproteobacteria bacterium]
MNAKLMATVLILAGSLLLIPSTAPAAEAEVKVAGETIEMLDAKGRPTSVTLAKPTAPAKFSVEGPGALKVHVRQLVDKTNPLTRVPVTVTVLLDGKEAKSLSVKGKPQPGVRVKGQDTLTPSAEQKIDVKIPAGTHEIVVKVSSSAVKGTAMRFGYDGPPPKTAVAAAPAPALEPIPLVPLAPAKKEPPPAPPAEPRKAEPPPVAAAPAPPPWAQPAPQPPKKEETPPPPLVPLAAPQKEPPPAVAKAPEPPKAPPPPPPEPQKAPKSELERARESMGLKPKPAQKEAAVKKEAEPPAGKRTWNVAEFTPKIGVMFPLQNGNPGPLFGLDAYGYPLRWLGVGIEGAIYWYSRDFAMSSALSGDQGGRYGLETVPLTLNVKFEPYRTKGFAPFGGLGGGVFFTKTTTENDWGGQAERSGLAPAWQIFGGVNGKLGFGQLMFSLAYASGRFTTQNADNLEAGGVTAAGGYQMGF